MNLQQFARKASRALQQDRLELHKYPAVQSEFRVPDLNALAQTVNGTTGTSGMSGHALFLYNLAWQMNAQLVVEIGLGPGDSTSVFLLAMKETGGRLVSIDIESQPVAESKVDLLGLRNRWEFVCQPSQEVGKQWDARRKIDILLIDGLHTYKQIELEYKLFKPHIRQGGYILFHDSETIRGVRKFTRWLRWRRGGVQFPFSNGLYVVRMS